jgi:hypothetical protein
MKWTNYYINLPKSKRDSFVKQLVEEEQLALLDSVYELINIELGVIVNYLDKFVK